MPIKKTKGKSGSAKPSDTLTWSVCLGSPTKEIKVFEVSFSEQNLRKALSGIYEKSYAASRGGGAFLKKAVPIVQQDLKSVGHHYSEEAIRVYFCKRLPDAAANKVLCRLSEKLRSRLLSIITEAQLAVERAHEIAAGLTEEKTKTLIDEIYHSSYKLKRSEESRRRDLMALKMWFPPPSDKMETTGCLLRTPKGETPE